ncbi:GAF domain-containing protein [Inmirania thermothiophila]|uniref:GAF domain-containing protein n=1 Tax=Inmirania thermothiophila TaxID=1750597 RepID=A0A3N1Y0G5_9GAMM|nr:GAF domain-containing protein [Inmirania thermothiophila]
MAAASRDEGRRGVARWPLPILVVGILLSLSAGGLVEALVRVEQAEAARAERDARALRLMNRVERSLARLWEAARLAAIALETPPARASGFQRLARHLLVGEPGIGAVGWAGATEALVVREGASGAAAVLYRAALEPEGGPLWFVPAGAGEAPWLGTLALRTGDGVLWVVVGAPESDAGLRVALEGRGDGLAAGWRVLLRRVVSLPGAELPLAVHGAPVVPAGAWPASAAVAALGLAVTLLVAGRERRRALRLAALGEDIHRMRRVRQALEGRLGWTEAALAAGGVAVWRSDPWGRGRWSAAAGAMLGLGAHARIRHRDQVLARVDGTDARAVRETLREAVARRRGYVVEYRVRRPDGAVRRVREKGAWTDAAGGGLVGVMLDVTELRRRELDLARENRALRLQRRGAEALAAAPGGAGGARVLAQALVEEGGYAAVWVARAEPGAALAWAGGAAKGVDVAALGPGRVPAGPWREALLGRAVHVDDLARIGSGEPWREEAFGRGLRAALFLPVPWGRRVVGVLALYRAEPGAWDEGELALLGALCEDLGAALAAAVRGAGGAAG